MTTRGHTSIMCFPSLLCYICDCASFLLPFQLFYTIPDLLAVVASSPLGKYNAGNALVLYVQLPLFDSQDRMGNRWSDDAHLWRHKPFFRLSFAFILQPASSSSPTSVAAFDTSDVIQACSSSYVLFTFCQSSLGKEREDESYTLWFTLIRVLVPATAILAWSQMLPPQRRTTTGLVLIYFQCNAGEIHLWNTISWKQWVCLQ